MSTVLIWQTITTSSDETSRLGELLGSNISSPAVIELKSDLGGGKTTFTRGLVKGLGSQDTVSSPTFTISRIYKAKDIEIHHFDFYRLSEAGVVADQLAESLEDKKVVTVVEWSDIVKDVLPSNRLTVEFKPTANAPDEREISVSYSPNLTLLIKKVESSWQELRP